MNPNTGEVLAQYSHPTFDPNAFVRGISSEDWQAMLEPEAGRPMFDRTLDGLYPPGSTIKPFTAAAALQQGAISAHTEFTQHIEDNKWTPENEAWPYQPITRVPNKHLPLDLNCAITYSDNIYFAWTALKTGADALLDYFSSIGFGEEFAYDLPVKKSNLYNSDSEFTRALLAASGYGQGELLITPLQMATLFCAFANDGDVPRARLVDRVMRTTETEYEVESQSEPETLYGGVVQQSTLDALLPMLRNVVETGTGTPAHQEGVRIAAKTGTSEIGGDKEREISWFVGFWSDMDEERLVLVMLDTKANAGQAKFDIAKDMLMPGIGKDLQTPEATETPEPDETPEPEA